MYNGQGRQPRELLLPKRRWWADEFLTPNETSVKLISTLAHQTRYIMRHVETNVVPAREASSIVCERYIKCYPTWTS